MAQAEGQPIVVTHIHVQFNLQRPGGDNRDVQVAVKIPVECGEHIAAVGRAKRLADTGATIANLMVPVAGSIIEGGQQAALAIDQVHIHIVIVFRIESINRVEVIVEEDRQGGRSGQRAGYDQVVDAAVPLIVAKSEPETRAAQLAQGKGDGKRGGHIRNCDLRAVPDEGGTGSRRISESKNERAVTGKPGAGIGAAGDFAAVLEHLETAIGPLEQAEFTTPGHRERIARRPQGEPHPFGLVGTAAIRAVIIHVHLNGQRPGGNFGDVEVALKRSAGEENIAAVRRVGLTDIRGRIADLMLTAA